MADEKEPTDRHARSREANPHLPAYRELWGVLVQLGVNIDSAESIESFSETIRWATEERLKSRKRGETKKQIWLGVFVAAATSFIGGLVSWMVSHLQGGTGHGP